MSTPRFRAPWWRLPLWILVVGLCAGSLLHVSLARGEPVNALWIVVASVCVFALAYRFHAVWLMAEVLTLDESRATPAKACEDGKDFVRTNRWVVFGHHFAAIAGPGPLVGPVLAAQFGYLPGFLWLLVGATLGGAVHDSVILFCSVRRRGKSLGQMVREEVGPVAGMLALVSVLAILVILIAVLGLVVVRALAHSPWGLFTIAATMPVALLLGIALRVGGGRGRWVVLASVFGVAGLLLSVWAGRLVHEGSWAPAFTLGGTSLAWWIIGYGVLASMLPVWLLLAPRDYLSTFMKIGVVALLGVAVVVLAPTLRMPALTRFIDGSGPVFGGAVFPFCFITIACGAVSGFHALIASGTTPKLLSSERDIRLVGYGAMITEMLVGVLALVAACAMQPGEYFAMNMAGQPAAVVSTVTSLGYPVTTAQMDRLAAEVGETTMVGRTGGAPTFAVGMARMFSGVLGSGAAVSLWYHFAIMFEALFILTTIDAGTRIGRFLVQEALGRIHPKFAQTDWWPSAILATFLVTAGWGALVATGSVATIWPMFGIANQLLAVLALALVTTMLFNSGRGKYAPVTILPMLFVISTTMTAGVQMCSGKFIDLMRQGQVLTGALSLAMTVFVMTCVATLLILAVSRWIMVAKGIAVSRDPKESA